MSTVRRTRRDPLERSLALAALAGALLGGVVVAVQLLGDEAPSPPAVTLPADQGGGGPVVIGPGSGELEAAAELVSCVNTELVANGGVRYIESGRTDDPAYQQLLEDAQIACTTRR